MLSKKEFIQEQKEYARMLGMTDKEYEELNNQLKIVEFTHKNDYDDDILQKLGLTNKDLKKKSAI